MAKLKRIVLDVLKPREPNILDFAHAMASLGEDHRVQVIVDEVDDKTESVILEVSGEDLDFDALKSVISELGGSLHSIDEVEVSGAAEGAETPSEPAD